MLFYVVLGIRLLPFRRQPSTPGTLEKLMSTNDPGSAFMKKHSQETHEIFGGPDKLELSMALLNSSIDRPYHVGFKLIDDVKTLGGKVVVTKTFANVLIHSITQEDGSGNNFCIGGYLREQVDGRWQTSGLKVDIFYSTKPSHRICGTIKLADT